MKKIFFLLVILALPLAVFGQDAEDAFISTPSAPTANGQFGNYSISQNRISYKNAVIWTADKATEWTYVCGDSVNDLLFLQEGTKLKTRSFLFSRGQNITVEATGGKNVIESKFAKGKFLLRFDSGIYSIYPAK
jgi:hypothetical protein